MLRNIAQKERAETVRSIMRSTRRFDHDRHGRKTKKWLLAAAAAQSHVYCKTYSTALWYSQESKYLSLVSKIFLLLNPREEEGFCRHPCRTQT